MFFFNTRYSQKGDTTHKLNPKNEVLKVRIKNIFQQVHKRISNTIHKCHSSTLKAKKGKVGFLKIL